MKNLMPLLLRGSFLVFYGLSLFQSKLALAQTPVLQMPLISVAEYDFGIKAPAGWNVRRNYRGKTLVLEDPLRSSRHGFEYSRNITVAIRQEVKPIDTLEAQDLSRKILREMGEGVSDFEIIEARIIDYRQKKDAILVFTSFRQGTVPMRQMHVFTSGSSNSVLISYTDMQDLFEAEGGLDQAWGSMMSAQLQGHAPERFDGLIYSGSGLAFLMTAAFLSKQLRRRKSKIDLMAEEDSMFEEDDDFETVKSPPQATNWQQDETQYAARFS